MNKYKLIDEIMTYAEAQENKHFIALGEICMKYDERYNEPE